MTYPNPAGGTTSLIVHAESSQLNGVHHYEDADGNWVDIDPLSQNVYGHTPISHLEYLRSKNEELRQIRVINPELISEVVSDFQDAMRRKA